VVRRVGEQADREEEETGAEVEAGAEIWDRQVRTRKGKAREE
jgi:hypothetical protein